MRLKTLILAGACLTAPSSWPVLAQDASVHVASPRQTFNFNTGWRMHHGEQADAATPRFDDAGWQAVVLPNAFNETEAFARDIRDLSTGITWYRKRFTLPSDAPVSDQGGKALLEFEGVRQAAEVWVNGTSVVLSENGAMAFGADITPLLRPGENVVAVRVDNAWDYKERESGSRFQWNDRNFNVNYGGITKNVRLHLTGDTYQTLPLWAGLGTTGQYVWADGFDLAARSATIHAETQVRNDGTTPRTLTLRAELRDRDGTLKATFDGTPQAVAAGESRSLSAEQVVADLQWWSWGHGYLYTVTTTLLEGGRPIDSVDVVTGFRKLDFDNGTVQLNGRAIQMHGYAQRSSNEWPAVGVSLPPWISDFSNQLLVDSGGNLVRWMHITPSKQDVESADRVGLLQAVPAGDSERDVNDRRWEMRVALMRDNIIYNRNNPSVVFWEGGNESISEGHMAELKAIRDRYDPHGGRAIGSREMLDSTIAEYGGEMLYINKSGDIPMWAMEYSRDESARLYQDNWTPPFHQDAPDYNRNGDSQAVEDVRRWYEYYRVRPGTGDRVSAGGVNIIWSDSNTHYRGDNNYRRSGEVDAMRLPKASFFAHQVMWNGWVDPAPGTHILGHWNYAPGTVKPVQVVSTGEEVELFLNGRSLGPGARSDGFLFTWPDVVWNGGVLEAVARHADRSVTRHKLETTGAPAALKLTPHTSPRGLVLDGADLALVDVEVVDAAGRRVPVANDMIHWTVDGPAGWRGGIAQGDSSGRPRPAVPVAGHDERYPGTAREEDNYILSLDLPVENGINRVMVRANAGGTGPVRLTARADGMAPVTIELPTAQPAAASGGLSTDFPERHQVASLSRGVTPGAPTLTPTRTTHHPVAVTSPGNAGELAMLNDDNELTRWVSDGTQRGAEITFDFGKVVRLSEVDMKAVGWRTRGYPLRLELDGRTVWEGATPQSLGYANIAFPPAAGRVLRIVQTAPVADRDAFGQIVELATPRAAGDTGADEVQPGWRLGIVEIDFHGPVAP
ncbi:sugar-binding domain-containing protein [Croceibacterium sp. TMG7-5b_MA50]|uniref:sugar-binding domain-containing protein n=1 Tax=Croceibacterium sp. TMG7-5b_MA50 TaxID=3121290 RepID=UPI00322145AF